MRSLFIVLISAGLVVAPVVPADASGSPARHKVDVARADAASAVSQQLRGQDSLTYIGLGVLALLVVLIIADMGDGDPESP